MIEEKMRKLVDRLLVKTRQGEIGWSETSVDGAYQASFPNYSVELEKEDGPVALRIYNSGGKIIDLISQTHIDRKQDTLLYGSEYEEKMIELYDLARRSALGVDKAIEDILSSLG